MHSSSSLLLAGALLFVLLGALLPFDPPDPVQRPAVPAAPAPPLNGLLTLRKDVREVSVSFIATDEDGRPVSRLQPEQVRVYSDSSPVAALTSFYQTGDLPLRLSVLVDTSDSVTPNFLAELKATDLFAARLVRPNIDHISWTGFASRSETYPQTSQATLRPAALGRNAIGQTALYDAVYEIATHDPKTSDGRLMRKALLLLSDGEDNWSRRTLDDAIQAAQAAGFTIYCMTAHDPHSDRAGDAPLKKLSAATGGRAYILSSYDHVGGVFEQIEKELRSQQSLTFAPATSECGWHSVKIVPIGHAVEVRSRNAYYIDGC